METVWQGVKDALYWCVNWVESYPKWALTIIVLLALSHLFF